jgi:hypothetical protein
VAFHKGWTIFGAKDLSWVRELLEDWKISFKGFPEVLASAQKITLK